MLIFFLVVRKQEKRKNKLVVQGIRHVFILQDPAFNHAALSSEEEAHSIPIHANHSHNIRTREFWSSEQLSYVA